MEPWVLPAQDAEAKKRSDSLKVTQIVREQEPRLPVSKSPVSWDQILSTCWSPGRTALAPFDSRAPKCIACIWRAQPGPAGRPHQCSLNRSLCGNRLFPSVSSQSCGMGAALGKQSRGEQWGSQPWQVRVPTRPTRSSLQLPPPFVSSI